MAQTIKIKRSTGSAAPSSLSTGELAFSEGSSKLYIGSPTNGTPLQVNGAILNEGSGTVSFGDNVTAAGVRTLLGLGTLATLSVVTAGELDVVGNGTSGQFLRSDGDGSFTWADVVITDNNVSVSNLETRLGQIDSSVTIGNGAGVHTTTSGNLTVSGNLSVLGTTTTLQTATLDVEDTNITLNHGSGDTSGSANGSGITIQDAVDASTDASITWNTTGNAFNFSNAIQLGGNTLVSSSRRIYASDGTDVKAAYSFSSNSGTGLSYETSRNRIKFLSGGAVRAYIQTPSTNPIAPAMYVDGRTEINGRVYATGDGNSGNWKDAYDWGDHSQAGYAAGNHNHNGVYEPVFTKNTAFNKNFGSAAGTVAQGNDSRINNGQTAFGWGNHASQGYVTEGQADFTDRWIELNKTSTVTNGNGGIYISRSGTNQDAVLFWDESDDKWKFGTEGYGNSIGVGDITAVEIESTDGSITVGGQSSAEGTEGDLSFNLAVATIDGGTY